MKDYNLKVLFSIFVFANVFYTIFFSLDGHLGGDFVSRQLKSDDSYLLVSLLLVLFSFYFFLFFFWRLLGRIKLKINIRKINDKNSFFDCVFLFLSLFLIFHYSIFGGGIGADFPKDGNLISHYFLAVFTPQWLLPIYLFYRLPDANRIYWITLVLYVISSVLSGLTGSLVLIFFLYLTNQVKINNKFKVIKTYSYLLIGILLYPFFRMFKMFVIQRNINDGDSPVNQLQIIRTLAEDGVLSVYFDMLVTSFQRLQLVSSYHYILQNINNLKVLFHNNDGIYFYETPWIYSMLMRRLGWENIGENTFQNIIALSISGSTTWQSQAGFFGHIFLEPYLSGIYLLLSALLILFFYLFSKTIDKNGVLDQYVWFFVLMYTMHGWFFASIEFFRACITFLLIVVVFNLISRSREKKV